MFGHKSISRMKNRNSFPIYLSYHTLNSFRYNTNLYEQTFYYYVPTPGETYCFCPAHLSYVTFRFLSINGVHSDQEPSYFIWWFSFSRKRALLVLGSVVKVHGKGEHKNNHNNNKNASSSLLRPPTVLFSKEHHQISVLIVLLPKSINHMSSIYK